MLIMVSQQQRWDSTGTIFSDSILEDLNAVGFKRQHGAIAQRLQSKHL